MLKQYIKINLIIVSSIFGLILLFFILKYLKIGIIYKLNKDKYIEVFDILGTKDNYVPQGLAYSDKYNVIIQTSYNDDNKPSKIFITDFESKEVLNELVLLNPDGSYNYSHVGGIATNNELVWITSDYEISTYNIEDLLNEKNEVKALTKEAIPSRGDFSSYYNNTLYIGDFYLKPFYNIKDDNPLLYVYDLDSIDYNNPKYVVKLPMMIQGMAFTSDDKIVFSRSFTYLINSKISIYDKKEKLESDYILNDKKIPYYEYKEENLVKEITIPPMSEGIFYKDDYLYINFESKSSKYKLAFPKMDKIIKMKLN